jgi:hypothetical protein
MVSAAADIVSIVDLYERDEIPSLPDNILPLTLADKPDVVDGKGNGNLDCIIDSITETRTSSGLVLVTLITTPHPA